MIHTTTGLQAFAHHRAIRRQMAKGSHDVSVKTIDRDTRDIMTAQLKSEGKRHD